MKELMQEDNVFDRLKEVSSSKEVLGMKMFIEKNTQIYDKLQGVGKAGRRECMAD